MKKIQRYFTDDRKEYYKLWYEYLKRNEDYETFCTSAQESLNDCLTLPMVQASFVYGFFRNVHRTSFAEWWERMLDKEKGIEPLKLGFLEPIQGSSLWLRDLIDREIGRFDRKYDRDPTAYELRDLLVKKMQWENSADSIYLKIRLHADYPFSTVRDRFKEIVQPKMERLSLACTFPEFSTKPRLPDKESLTRYLVEYDMKQQEGFKVREIISAVPDRLSNMNSWRGMERDVDLHRIVKADIAKARRIKDNTLLGIFPGEYDFTQKRRRQNPTIKG